MQVQVGEIVEGKVTGITKFGVFVDLGDSQTGLVHISEVAQTYVNDINEHVKVGDMVKMKVLRIEDGKIGLSIKRAMAPAPKPPRQQTDFSRDHRREPKSFEDMMNQFKQSSDEKFSDLKRKNPDMRRQSKRGASLR